MHVCTFFGHHDCPAEVKPELRRVLIELIENQSVNRFYVGNHGAFDRMVYSALRELKPLYPEIQFAVVFAYIPQNVSASDDTDFSDTMLPDGIETVPKRFAIPFRNQWMLQQADIVVSYVRHSFGGAAKFTAMAERKKKTVIRL